MDSNAQSFIVTSTNKLRLVPLLLLLAAGMLGAQTRTYAIGPAGGSRFALEVYKTGLMGGKKHVFIFERYGGELVYDAAKPDDAKVRFTVDSGSVNCTDTWINEGSRKKVQAAARDLLQPDQHPQMVFTSSKATPKGENQYDVEGMLTIRGVARPITVRVTTKADEFEGRANLSLKNYGLKPPSSGLSLGLIGTKDEMTVQFHLKAR